jgi:hypothetical protein
LMIIETRMHKSKHAQHEQDYPEHDNETLHAAHTITIAPPGWARPPDTPLRRIGEGKAKLTSRKLQFAGGCCGFLRGFCCG